MLISVTLDAIFVPIASFNSTHSCDSNDVSFSFLPLVNPELQPKAESRDIGFCRITEFLSYLNELPLFVGYIFVCKVNSLSIIVLVFVE